MPCLPSNGNILPAFHTQSTPTNPSPSSHQDLPLGLQLGLPAAAGAGRDPAARRHPRPDAKRGQTERQQCAPAVRGQQQHQVGAPARAPVIDRRAGALSWMHTTDYLELRDSSRGKKKQQQNLGISIHNGLKGVKLVFPNIPEFKF